METWWYRDFATVISRPLHNELVPQDGNITVQQEFWKWFVQHERELFDFDPAHEIERERIFDKLAIELQKVHPDLTFEFGPKAQEREFVVSAGGIKSLFPAVIELPLQDYFL